MSHRGFTRCYTKVYTVFGKRFTRCSAKGLHGVRQRLTRCQTEVNTVSDSGKDPCQRRPWPRVGKSPLNDDSARHVKDARICTDGCFLQSALSLILAKLSVCQDC